MKNRFKILFFIVGVSAMLLSSQVVCAKPNATNEKENKWYSSGNVGVKIYKEAGTKKTEYINKTITVSRDSAPDWKSCIIKPYTWQFSISGDGEMALEKNEYKTFKEYSLDESVYEHSWNPTYEGYNGFAPIIKFTMPKGYRYKVNSMKKNYLLEDHAITIYLPKTAYNLSYDRDTVCESVFALHAAQIGLMTAEKKRYTGNSVELTLESNKTMVKFNGAGADGEMPQQRVVYDTQTVLNENSFSKTGYHFCYWRDEAGNKYKDGADVSNAFPTQSIMNLEAVWEANQGEIIYEGNGNTRGCTQESDYVYGITNRLRANGFEKDGYTFTGWNTKADGTGINFESNIVSDSIKKAFPSGQATLYAQWRPNIYNIKYVNNSYSKGSLPKSCRITYGSGIKAPYADKNLVAKDKLFAGWSTSKNAATIQGAPLFEPGDDISKILAEDGATINLYPIFMDKDKTKIFNVPKTIYKNYQESKAIQLKVKFGAKNRIVKFEKNIGGEWEQLAIRKLTGKESGIRFVIPKYDSSGAYRVVVRSSEGSMAAAANVDVIVDRKLPSAAIKTDRHVKKEKAQYIVTSDSNGKGYRIKVVVTPAHKQKLILRTEEGVYVDAKRIAESKKKQVVIFDLNYADINRSDTRFVLIAEEQVNGHLQRNIIAEFSIKKTTNPRILFIGNARLLGFAGYKGSVTGKTSASVAGKNLAKIAGIPIQNILYYAKGSGTHFDWFSEGKIKNKSLRSKLQSMTDSERDDQFILLWPDVGDVRNVDKYIADVKGLHRRYPGLRIHILSVGQVYKKPYGYTTKEITRFNSKLKKTFANNNYQGVNWHPVKVKINKKSGPREVGGVINYNTKTNKQFAGQIGEILKRIK